MTAMKSVNFFGIPRHMARIAEIAADQGLSLSALLRQLIAKEIYRAAKAARE